MKGLVEHINEAKTVKLVVTDTIKTTAGKFGIIDTHSIFSRQLQDKMTKEAGNLKFSVERILSKLKVVTSLDVEKAVLSALIDMYGETATICRHPYKKSIKKHMFEFVLDTKNFIEISTYISGSKEVLKDTPEAKDNKIRFGLFVSCNVVDDSDTSKFVLEKDKPFNDFAVEFFIQK